MPDTALGANSGKSARTITFKSFIRMGKTCMLKIRLQGTVNDIRWFKTILERDKTINMLCVSELYANKGTKKYFRVYAEVERNRQ